MSQIRRRQFLLAVGAGSLLVTLPTLAQQEKRVRRIGYFSGTNAQSSLATMAAFREGMAELRWVEGRDYVIDERYGNGIAQAGPAVAAELVASRPDLLLVSGDTAASLLLERTKTIPLVFTIAQDPVGNRLASSLQRPGGNATGLSSLTRDLGAKRLQLLKEAFPRIAHAVLLFQSAGTGSASQVKEIEEAAARLKIRVTSIGLGQAADIEPAFKRGAALGGQGYIVTQGYFLGSQRQAIVDRSTRARVPIIFTEELSVEAGGLMSYGPLQRDNYRRAAVYVDKILKGAKPGDLPIEQPTKFELALNLKTAKAMGLAFPQSFLVRADRVIE